MRFVFYNLADAAAQDILIKKGIVEEDDVLRGKGVDPDERRLEEAIVSWI